MEAPLDTKAAAKATGLAVATLEKYRIVGGDAGPPFLKLNRSVRYDPADLRSWMDARRVRSTSEQIAA